MKPRIARRRAVGQASAPYRIGRAPGDGHHWSPAGCRFVPASGNYLAAVAAFVDGTGGALALPYGITRPR